MTVLVLRIVLTALACGFLGWIGYIVYLGLQSFFGKNHDVQIEHRKRRGGTCPNK